ncbi:MAG: amino acid ABC transporter substrate-binding protein [Candidatus Dormibacteraeota bacterium]|nr:amino acid ABC transporter substrate-binding protein [Candidatus Dormibacteraeota bacterium]
MKMTRFHPRSIASLAVAGLLAVACGGSSGGTTSGGSTGETLTFGAPLGLTGSLTKESQLTQQGYDLWVEWINQQGGIVVNGVKHPVKIKYYDDTSKADQSAVLMQKLITEDKAQFLLGPYGSAATATDAAIAEKNQVPMVEANGAAQSIFSNNYRYTFGVLSPANKYLQGVVDLAATLTPKPTKIAMLSADDNFSIEVADAINQYAPTKGMSVVLYKKYKSGSTNLVAEVQAAKNANPDIVLNSGHLQEAIAINKSAKEQQLNAKMFGYSVGPSTPDFTNALGKDADYVYDGSQWTPQVKYKNTFYLSVKDYVDAYKKKYPGQGEPDYHVAESTAACLAFQRAIENAKSTDPKKVRDALAKLDVETFFGRIKFDDRGINTFKPMVVEQIQGGVHHTVFPPDVADAKAKYPTPNWDQR